MASNRPYTSKAAKPDTDTGRKIILFRTEASRSIGTGHLMRCMALAEICMEQGNKAVFIMTECPSMLATRLITQGIELVLLDDGTDAAELLSIIKPMQPAGIVIDGYGFDEAYRRSLFDYGVFVLAMDDGAIPHLLHADIVVNVSPLATPADYETIAAGAHLLLGPGYVSLRREFRHCQPVTKRNPAEGQRVLITFGGSDPLNLTLAVVEALLDNLPELVLFDVVIGGAAADQEKIDQFARDHINRVQLHKNTIKMAELMQHATLAVSAAGSTLWELAHLAVPTIAVVVADNQAVTLEPPLCKWFGTIDARKCSERAIAQVAVASRALWHDDEARMERRTSLSRISVGEKAATICNTFYETFKRPA